MQRLGLRTSLASLVGLDQYGDFCCDFLEREGVGTSLIRREASVSTGITISLNYADDRLLLTRLGSMSEVDAGNIGDDILDTVRHVHCGSLFLLDRLRGDLTDLFRRSKAAGCTISVDPGWDPSGRWDPDALNALLPLVDVFLPNGAEARAMTSTDTDEDALEALRAIGARRVALKLGAVGGICVSDGGEVRESGLPVSLVDTTGAGDAFNAGFVRGMLAGWGDDACLRLAVGCGAMAVTAAGGTTALTGLGAVRDLLRRDGRRLPDD